MKPQTDGQDSAAAALADEKETPAAAEVDYDQELFQSLRNQKKTIMKKPASAKVPEPAKATLKPAAKVTSKPKAQAKSCGTTAKGPSGAANLHGYRIMLPPKASDAPTAKVFASRHFHRAETHAKKMGLSEQKMKALRTLVHGLAVEMWNKRFG